MSAYEDDRLIIARAAMISATRLCAALRASDFVMQDYAQRAIRAALRAMMSRVMRCALYAAALPPLIDFVACY